MRGIDATSTGAEMSEAMMAGKMSGPYDSTIGGSPTIRAVAVFLNIPILALWHKGMLRNNVMKDYDQAHICLARSRCGRATLTASSPRCAVNAGIVGAAGRGIRTRGSARGIARMRRTGTQGRGASGSARQALTGRPAQALESSRLRGRQGKPLLR